MKQILHWLRRYWVKSIHVRSADRPKEQPLDRQSGASFEGEVEPPVQRVYYSTLLRNYSGYIDKGRITRTKADGPA